MRSNSFPKALDHSYSNWCISITTASTKQRGHDIICFLCHHLGDSGMSGDPIKRQQARISCRPSDTLQPNDNPSTPIFTRAAIWQQYPCTYASCMVIIIYSTYVQQAILSIYTAYQISSNACHWCQADHSTTILFGGNLSNVHWYWLYNNPVHVRVPWVWYIDHCWYQESMNNTV